MNRKEAIIAMANGEEVLSAYRGFRYRLDDLGILRVGENGDECVGLSEDEYEIVKPPKVKKKFYLFCTPEGDLSKFFFSYDALTRWECGEEFGCDEIDGWIRTNTYIEVEV